MAMAEIWQALREPFIVLVMISALRRFSSAEPFSQTHRVLGSLPVFVHSQTLQR
jgi:hypothetical protein